MQNVTLKIRGLVYMFADQSVNHYCVDKVWVRLICRTTGRWKQSCQTWLGKSKQYSIQNTIHAQIQLGRRLIKGTLEHVRTVKVQPSLRIRAYWSGSSLFAYIIRAYGYLVEDIGLRANILTRCVAAQTGLRFAILKCLQGLFASHRLTYNDDKQATSLSFS